MSSKVLVGSIRGPKGDPGVAGIPGPPGEPGADGTEALLEHVADLTPHPVYDDGPSLTLLYQNAKV